MKENSMPNNMQFWRKLRLIKRCQYCRQKESLPLILSQNIARKYNTINQESHQTFLINWLVSKSQKKAKREERLKKQIQRLSSTNINLRYIQMSSIFQQLKYLIHYYRFYSYEPVVICEQELFFKLESHHNRKKMVEYNQIKKIFKSQQNKVPNQNMSTKLKTIAATTEKFLDEILSSSNDQSEDFLFEQIGLQNMGKSLQEIDNCYKFMLTETSDRKKLSSKNMGKKRNKDWPQFRLPKKSNKKDITGSNFKKSRKCNSCENLITSPCQKLNKISGVSPNPMRKSQKNRKGIKQKMDEKITSCPNEQVVKEYIMNLKMKLKEEKKNLFNRKKEKKKEKKHQISECYNTVKDGKFEKSKHQFK